MMKQTKLAKAIAFVVAGTALSAANISNASASTTYYNTYNAYDSNIITDEGAGGTDGWRNTNTNGLGWATASHWTSPTTPFGTTAKVVNWAAEITTAGDALTISSKQSHDDYDIWADIDTAKGAWFDGATGWGHNTDVGLFRSDVKTVVTINITSLQPSPAETWTNFGVSIFEGMSNNAWDHHGPWNVGSPTTSNNPLGSNNLTFVKYDNTVDAINSITFLAEANKVYSILLGGNSGGSNYDPHAGYSLSIATAPVPVPGAVWLFGSALVGLAGINRRKKIAA